MNFEYFIAKRIIGSKSYKSNVSASIIKIGIVAIALGIIVMLIAIATGFGLEQKIRDKVVAFNGDITIGMYDDNNSQESMFPISTQQNFYPKLNVEGTTHIQAVVHKFGVIRTETDFEGVITKGVGSDFNWMYFKDFLVEGKLPDYSGKRNEDVLVSTYILNRLGFKLNDTFQLYFNKEDENSTPSILKCKIVGVYNSGFEDFDKNILIADIRHMQRIKRWQPNQVGHFEVFVDDFDNLNSINKAVNKQLHATLQATPITQKYYTIFEWISIFAKNIYVIIIIMIIVAGINMITALLVLILERTQTIGVFKALGSSNWSIRKIFLYNAAYLIGVGLFWGNLIGLGVLLLQKYFKIVPLNPEVYYVNEVPVAINFLDVLILNIGTFILCLIMLLIPSYIITKISPIKAIQFE